MDKISRRITFAFAAALLLPAAPALAQEQAQPQSTQPVIPNDFTLPPGEGEVQVPADPPQTQATPVIQTAPESEQAAVGTPRPRVREPRPAAPRGDARPTAQPTSQAVAGRAPAPPAAEQAAEETPEQATQVPPPPPEQSTAPIADQGGSTVPSGFNWLLTGLLIMGAALLALIVFVRRQKFETTPDPIAVVDLAKPSATPVLQPVSPPVALKPQITSPSTPPPADGQVKSRIPASGLVTTNLAAKRRDQVAKAQPKPMRLRISFDGF